MSIDCETLFLQTSVAKKYVKIVRKSKEKITKKTEKQNKGKGYESKTLDQCKTEYEENLTVFRGAIDRIAKVGLFRLDSFT